MPAPRAPTKPATTRSRALPLSKNPKGTSTDELATQFARAVRIDERKPRGKAVKAPSTQVDPKVQAMVVVNDVSKALSTLIPSSDNQAKPKSTRQLAVAAELMPKARDALDRLRGIMNGDADVERAASSIVSKLVSLERVRGSLVGNEQLIQHTIQHKEAVVLLSDMRPCLSGLYNSVTSDVPTTDDQLSLLHIPLPLSEQHPTDSTRATLLATYLSHALATLSHIVFSAEALAKVSSTCQKDGEVDEVLEEMLQELFDTNTLLKWQPYLTPVLPPKQVDTFLTRAYSAITKSSAPHSSTHPRAVFALRHYSLLCLLRTAPGSIAPSMFWDQANKFCSSLFSRTTTPEGPPRKKDDLVLRTFSRVVEYAEGRLDHAEFMSGAGFTSFCEIWLDFAKRVRLCSKRYTLNPTLTHTQAGRMDELDHITRVMNSGDTTRAQSTVLSQTWSRSPSATKPSSSERDTMASRELSPREPSSRDAVRIAATFVKAIATLEDQSTNGIHSDLTGHFLGSLLCLF